VILISGNFASISASDHTSGSMQYDLKNRISEIDWQTGFLFLSDKITEQLAYDPAGNVLSQTREFGKLSYGTTSADFYPHGRLRLSDLKLMENCVSSRPIKKYGRP
jgi:hypothetical protein